VHNVCVDKHTHTHTHTHARAHTHTHTGTQRIAIVCDGAKQVLQVVNWFVNAQVL
jgi:hypothetical protein